MGVGWCLWREIEVHWLSVGPTRNYVCVLDTMAVTNGM